MRRSAAKAGLVLRQSSLALAALGVGIVLAVAAWRHVDAEEEGKARARFELHVDGAKDDIRVRVGQHLEILRGAAGLFDASEAVTRDEWRRYVETLDLRRFPGVQGLGFIRRVPQAQKESFEQRMRREGLRDYAIRPAGSRDDYYPVEYFAAVDPDLPVLGLDHGAYEVGRAALERARDLGLPAASGRLASIVDRGHKPRFLIVWPIYRRDMAHESVEERRAALSGFVYARYRIEELMDGAMGTALSPNLHLEIFDGGVNGREPAAPQREQLLYDSGTHSTPHAPNADAGLRFRKPVRFELAGREWLLFFTTHADSPLEVRHALSAAVLLFGMLLAAAVAAIVFILSAGRRQIAQELQREKTFIAQALDVLPLNVFVKDQAGRFVRINRQCARLLGLTPEEAVGKTDLDVFPAEVARRLTADDAQVRAGSGLLLREETLVSGGKEVFALAGKTLIEPADGSEPLLLGFSIDISERRRAEIALRESEERLQSILDNTLSVIYAKDIDGRYLLANRAFTDHVGVPPGEIVGKTDDELFPKDLAESFRDNDRRVLARGQAMEFEEFTREEDGPHTWLSVKFPLRDANGKPYAVCGISTDITQRLLLERKAASVRSSQLSRSLIFAIDEGVIRIDAAHRVIFANPKAQQLLGIDEAGMLGRKLCDVVRVVSADGCRLADETCPAWDPVRAGQPFRSEDWSFTRNDGSIFPVGMAIVPVVEDDKLSGSVLSFADIGPRKQTEDAIGRHIAELARINAELDEFTYIASHDLQAPLRKIVSFGDWLRRDLGENLPPRAAADLAFIVDAAGRLQALVLDLLALSRAGKAAMAQEPVDLNAVADRVLELLSPRIRECGAEISRDPLPAVRGDALLLEQLYQNLIGNALKFVGAKPPRIRLTAQRRDGEWLLGVADDGIGIAPEYAEEIFAPFKRLHDRTAYEGSGIGLAICRKVVERHGGRIWVESQAGQGAHFRFVLPVPEAPT